MLAASRVHCSRARHLPSRSLGGSSSSSVHCDLVEGVGFRRPVDGRVFVRGDYKSFPRAFEGRRLEAEENQRRQSDTESNETNRRQWPPSGHSPHGNAETMKIQTYHTESKCPIASRRHPRGQYCESCRRSRQLVLRTVDQRHPPTTCRCRP
jgi:hypothetical protein